MYIHWIVLFASFGLIFAGWTPERILGGQLVSISSVPWQASLQLNGEHECGAAIYSNQILITAAHCVRGQDPSSMTVRVGSSNRHHGGQLVNVSRIIIHEKYYWPYSDSNDLAIIRLQRPLVFNSDVQSIPLASRSPASGSEAFVSGWGRTGLLLPKSNYLLGVKLSIVDYKSCSKITKQLITRDMICAGAPGKGTCISDSGGPLVSGGELVGIVSFGFGCENSRKPDVYADVAKLRLWILEAVKRIE